MSRPPQQPYYGYHQHPPGPSQPPWQPDPARKGWGDPRVSSPAISSPVASFPATQNYQAGAAHQNLPPPPPPPPGGFPAAPTIHPPNAAQYDTSVWGVKYNQGQQQTPVQDQALRPPLPPRPASAQSGNQGWSASAAGMQPPTPPPRPPEYAVPSTQHYQPPQSQYYPHEQFSHGPSSHGYEPQQNRWSNVQQQPANAGSWQTGQHQPDGPVSPIEHNLPGWHTASPPPPPPPAANQYSQHSIPQQPQLQHKSSVPTTGPSALGSGGPSDWQHYPGDDQFYQEQSSQPQTHKPSQSFTATPEQIYTSPAYQSRPPQSQDNNGPPANTRPPGAYGADVHQDQSAPSAPFPAPASTPPSNHNRMDSSQTSTTTSGVHRSGTIDSVIQAWSSPQSNDRPIEPLNTPGRPVSVYQGPAVPKVEMSSTQTQTDFPPIVKTETKVVTKVETREIDPYEDLKNEYRTSLNRYATMLRQEMAASTEQEKMKLVSEFVNKEIKLRSVMFNADPAELVRSSELAELRKLAQKVKEQETMSVPATISKTGRDGAGRASPPARPSQIDTLSGLARAGQDDGFVVVDKDGEDGDYSPGGRPRVNVPTRAVMQQRPVSPAVQPGRVGTPQRFIQPGSPSDNAPMTLDDYAMPETRSTSVPRNGQQDSIQRPGSVGPPLPQKPNSNNTPIPFQPARPAYTPFRYTEASGTPPPALNSSTPADAAYLKLRHDAAADSGRLLSQEPPLLTVTAPDRSQSATPSRARQQQEEAFIGLLRQQSNAVKKPSNSPPPDAPAPLRAGTPLRRRPSLPPMVKSTESLRESLPKNLDKLTFGAQKHPRLAPISVSLTKLADDFSFIHATVVDWDRENRRLRQRLDSERTERESDNQSRIDELFHDNQIGYADIAGLEEDFKLEEASKKYKEDQDELDSFTRGVYDRVTQRLEGELSELEALRIKTLDVLDLESQSASSRIRTALKDSNAALDKAPLADAMSTMLIIYRKIEFRHKKIAEAQFERERRRKRLELSVLYTNGDTAGVKKLEKDFEKARSMQILSEARKCDERANKLMDSFDRAVVKGLAENQEWIDEMSNKASLLRDLVLGSESNGPQGSSREELLYGPSGIKETIDLLGTAVDQVLRDSKDLVSMSSEADNALNEADFAMFLAEAKIADASEQEFEKLRLEKTKEDKKLKDEAEGRMNGVQRGPDEIFGLIKDIRDNIGNDRDHQVRINQALEAAKKRNQQSTDGKSGQS